MRVEESTYDEKPYLEADGVNTFCGTYGTEYQPSFGIEIAWNEPKRLWRPHVIINFWKIRVQFGWLWDFPPEN